MSINAIVKAFKFTKIQRWEHKIAEPTATELNGKKSKKDPEQRRAHNKAEVIFAACVIT